MARTWQIWTVLCVGWVWSCAPKETVIAKDPRTASPHFAAVQQNLDMGGHVLLYMDVEGDLQAGTELLQKLLQSLADEAPEAAFLKSLDVKKLVGHLGLDNLLAIGMSSVKDWPIFRNRAVVRLRGPRAGLLRSAGGPAHPFEVAKQAPQDVDIAWEEDLHLKAVVDVVVAILQEVMGPKADALLTGLQTPVAGTPLSLAQLIDHLNTRIVLVFRMHEDRTWKLPGAPIGIPQMDLLIGLDGLGELFDAAKKLAANLPFLKPADEEGAEMLTLATPIPGEVDGLAPLVAKDKASGRVYLATSAELLREYRAGRLPRLSQAESFQKATKGLPVEGNGLSYLSPAFVGKLRGFLDRLARLEPKARSGLDFAFHFLPAPGIPIASVRTNLPEGLLFTSNTVSSHKSSILAMMYANPFIIGILAAVAIPSFVEYQNKAKGAAIHSQLTDCAHAIAGAAKESKKSNARWPTLPRTLPRVCPAQVKELEDLDETKGPLVYGMARAGYLAAGWMLDEPTQACFQYELRQAGSKKAPPRFACHAWSDVDDDQTVTHDLLTVTWDPARADFDYETIKKE